MAASDAGGASERVWTSLTRALTWQTRRAQLALGRHALHLHSLLRLLSCACACRWGQMGVAVGEVQRQHTVRSFAARRERRRRRAGRALTRTRQRAGWLFATVGIILLARRWGTKRGKHGRRGCCVTLWRRACSRAQRHQRHVGGAPGCAVVVGPAAAHIQRPARRGGEQRTVRRTSVRGELRAGARPRSGGGSSGRWQAELHPRRALPSVDVCQHCGLPMLAQGAPARL